MPDLVVAKLRRGYFLHACERHVDPGPPHGRRHRPGPGQRDSGELSPEFRHVARHPLAGLSDERPPIRDDIPASSGG